MTNTGDNNGDNKWTSTRDDDGDKMTMETISTRTTETGDNDRDSKLRQGMTGCNLICY